MTDIAMRYLKEWDIDPRQTIVRIDRWFTPEQAYPLSGHRGNCAKVTAATVTGKTDTACSCRDTTPQP